MEKNSLETNRFILNPSEVKLEKPERKVDIKITEYGGFDIGVGIVDTRKKSPEGKPIGGRTIIYPLAYDSRLIDAKSKSSVEIDRLQTIAETLTEGEGEGALVIGIEEPGIGVSEKANANKSFIENLKMLKNGYGWAAHQMLGALSEATSDSLNGTHVEFLGYAQSAAIAAEMVKELSDPDSELQLKVDRLMIVEPINDQKRNIFNILKATGQELEHGEHHFADNKKYDWLNQPNEDVEKNIKKLKSKQNVATILSGVALSMRPMITPLLEAVESDREHKTSGISQAEFDFLKSKDSEISREETIEKTIRQLRDAAPLARIAFHLIEGSDGVKMHLEAFQSMPNVHQLFDEGPLA
jgi:hypothetical protein